MINKTKPHSPEAETAVIASCLLKEDGSVYDEVSQIVTPTDFYIQRNQILFASIASLVSTGVSLDEVAILEQLRKQGDEESVGGLTSHIQHTGGRRHALASQILCRCCEREGQAT
jgi:replicative DNA helicase